MGKTAFSAELLKGESPPHLNILTDHSSLKKMCGMTLRNIFGSQGMAYVKSLQENEMGRKARRASRLSRRVRIIDGGVSMGVGVRTS